MFKKLLPVIALVFLSACVAPAPMECGCCHKSAAECACCHDGACDMCKKGKKGKKGKQCPPKEHGIPAN